MPGLIDLKTNLRSLSYGSGTGEPFIRRPLPAYDETPENPYLGANGIGRQGARFAANEDKIRLSRFFDRGSVFPLKQKLLSLQGPQTPYAPIRGTFLSNNIVLQTSLGGTGTHINSRGILPFGSKFTGYEYLTKTFYNDKGNRLSVLYNSKIARNTLSPTEKSAALAFGISNLGDNILFTYPGGGNAPLTVLKKADNSNTSNYVPGVGEYKNVFVLGPQEISLKTKLNSTGFSGNNGSLTNFVLDIPSGNRDTPTGKRVLGRLTKYSEFNRTKTFGVGDPGNDKLLNRQEYYKGAPKKTDGTDLINFKKVYSSTQVDFEQSSEDMIKFYIAVLDNNNPEKKTYIHFRAFIEGVSDNYSANWNGVNYPGRGEEFFKYGGFSRDIGFSFKVHVASRAELFPTYQKLNYLASVMTPDYSAPGYMRGNIVQLTVGDYFNDLPGVITNFSYNLSDETSWDIARNDDGTIDKNSAELPTLINVDSFSFKPIHNFVPRIVKNLDNPESKFISLGSDFKGYS